MKTFRQKLFLIIIFSLCLLIIFFGFKKNSTVYRESKRWITVQRAGGVPYFWKNTNDTIVTLMNPPGTEHRVVLDSGKTGFKKIDRNGLASDYDISPQKKTPYRMICLGDSVTYGLLPNDQSYPQILEDQLNWRTTLRHGHESMDATERVPPKKWEVVNAGRGGESTYTSLLRYKYILSRFEADHYVVGWFAGNEPVEMLKENVYTGPRVTFKSGKWIVLWEDDSVMAAIPEADLQPYVENLQKILNNRRQPLRKNKTEIQNYVMHRSNKSGVLSARYALYGSTSIISAFRFLRYEKEENDFLFPFTARTLAVVRTFREMLGQHVSYLLLPEAFEVDPAFVKNHHEFNGLMEQLELNEADLTIAADLKNWMGELLKNEGVALIDPTLDLIATCPSNAAFRRLDLHPTAKANEVIAQNIFSDIIQRQP